MFTLMMEAGLFGILIGFVIIGATVYIGLSLKLIIQRSDGEGNLQEYLSGILQMGLISAVLGVAGTSWGLYEAFSVIKDAPEISPSIIYGGLQIASSSTVLGLSVYILCAIVWFGLKQSAKSGKLS